jgi:hypothetical protein
MDNKLSIAPLIWAASSMEMIRPDDSPGNKTFIELYSARGEYEAFQVGIQAPNGGLQNVNFSITDLKNQEGYIISKDNIRLYREHYVYVSPSVPTEKNAVVKLPYGPGWYPDALIPFIDYEAGKVPAKGILKAAPFDLKEKKNQPIWVDIFVPRDASPGEYKGKFTVTSDQGNVEGDIRLTVWDFELPLKPSLKSAFHYKNRNTSSAYKMLLKHKLMPDCLQMSDKGSYIPDQRKLIDKYGLNCMGLKFWSGALISTGTMTNAPSANEIKVEAAKHEPDLFLYNYTADEIDRYKELYEPVKEWGRNLHQADIPNLVVMKPVPELYDDGSGTGRSAVDIWVVLPLMYEASPENITTVLCKGDEVWSYNCLLQDEYSPKWLIGYDFINFRIQPGFISQSLGLTGLLYWRVDHWTNNPWRNVHTYFEAPWGHFPGEGMLVYPGENVGVEGVVPSIRLKALREGVEDFEYIQILKSLGYGEWALEVARSVGADWRNWTRDYRKLEDARRLMGEKIDSLAANK